MVIGLDFLNEIVNVQWGGVEQQGLLAEYPPGPGAPEFESIQDVMKGTPTAYAIGSGQSFPGINMGASGLGHTVLTRGLVCFGKPRDGPSCFIACPGFKYYVGEEDNTLLRGALSSGDSKTLVWSTTGSAPADSKLAALSFSEGAFFAVYYDSGESRTTIQTSFDGQTWTASGFAEAVGAVAAIRIVIGDEGEVQIIYTAVGDIGQEHPSFQNRTSNLFSASGSGADWATHFEMGMLSEPGCNFATTANYACTVAGSGTVLVAPATTKVSVADPSTGSVYVETSAAAAVSGDGSGWDTISVGGTPAGLNQRSWGLATAYIRTAKDSGHFLLTDHDYFTGESITPGTSRLYQSSDGRSWSSIKTNGNWMATLSAVAKDLNSTEIVTI